MKVAVVVGNKSDLPVMREAIDILCSFDIGTVVDIVSVHCTPEKLMDSGTNAHCRGFNVIAAGTGGVAHLLGTLAAMLPLPITGVPVKSSNSIDGWGSVLSILQMLSGVPVVTVALNRARNAGILAAQILASQQSAMFDKITSYKKSSKQAVLTAATTLSDE